MNFNILTDKEWVKYLVGNNPDAIVYFFYKKYIKLFVYNLYKIFPYKVEIMDFVNEFYLYLQDNDWKRLKTYNPELNLDTWICVVSYRFFKNYKLSMIDFRGVITITDKWDMQIQNCVFQFDFEVKRDIMKAIEQITNERDKQIAELIIFNDNDADEISKQFGLNIDYVYTIKNRIIKTLRTHLKEYKNE